MSRIADRDGNLAMVSINESQELCGAVMCVIDVLDLLAFWIDDGHEIFKTRQLQEGICYRKNVFVIEKIQNTFRPTAGVRLNEPSSCNI